MIRKGQYSVQENMMVSGTWSVFKGTEVLAMNLPQDEAQSLLDRILEAKHQKITELSLDIETQEGIAGSWNFTTEQRVVAKRKLSELQKLLAERKQEIGEL